MLQTEQRQETAARIDMLPSVMRHWHPVALGRELGSKPIGVRLAGVEIALFRDESRTVAAITDICPHRKMRLSLGKVVGNCLQCRYHGWTFDPHCNGESAGTPKLRVHGTSFEAREANGMIWVRARGSETSFPDFDPTNLGYSPMILLKHDVRAPLELVLDNFNELEHTPTTHGQFGYQLERMHDVELELEPHDDVVYIRYRGPSKPYPFLFRTWMQISKHVIHHVDGYTRYSPVHTVGDYRWTDEHTGRESWVRVRHAHFLTPLDEQTTRLFTLSFMKLKYPVFNPLLGLVRRGMRPQYEREVREDQFVLENIVCQDTSLQQLKLSRFDKIMGMNRDRIARHYQ
jgi:phenylpropionate dioxygenase-like ring-hydroxylating dioxygenase large terminal subunit